MDQGHGHRAFADRARDALDRARAHVAGDEHARDGRLEHVRVAFERPARDERGFILAGPDAKAAGWILDRDPYLLETTVPGVFVAGDVRARSIKRVASAVGEGSMAVSLVHEYLSDT